MSEPKQTPSRRPLILVGVDGSPGGLRAVVYAMREAQHRGADLRIVHVVTKAFVSGLWGRFSSPGALRRAGEARIKDALEVLAEGGFPADRVTSVVLAGRPGEVLSELSELAQVMVVGRRSFSGLERMFVGSTSGSVAALARCPVIVISEASTLDVAGRLRVVAVAVSVGPANRSALEWGFREAAVRKARLRVVHVVPPASGVAEAGLDVLGERERELAVAATVADLDHLLGPLEVKQPDVTVEVEVLFGVPVDELVAVSKTVDLLILNVHPNAATLGATVRGLMARSHCPLGLTRYRCTPSPPP